MAGLVQVGATRPVFNPGLKTITFTTPANVLPGDVLLLVVAFDPSDSFALPAGWTAIATLAGTDNFAVLARDVVQGDPTSIAITITSATKEWQGQAIALRGGSPSVMLEASAVASFAAATPASAPTVTCHQAIDLELAAWSWAGSTLPTNLTGLIDSYTTALETARSFSIALNVANATGTLPAVGAANGATTFTGSAISLVLRDRVPVVPLVLFDPVPGNIGLQGIDTRGLPEQVNLG